MHVAFFRVSVGALDVRAASGHSLHFLLIRKTVVCFFSWLAVPCVRSGWPGPGICARDGACLSFPPPAKLSIVSLVAAHPDCVGFAQRVSRKVRGAYYNGEGTFIIYTFSLASHALGRQVSQAPSHILPFSCICFSALDVRAASGHSHSISF